MKRIKFFLPLFAMMATVLCTLAQPAGYKALTDAEKKAFIETMSNNMQSVQCTFKQEKKSAMLSEGSVSEGIMIFAKPSSLRWEYTKPNPSVVVMKDGKAKVSDASGKSQAKNGRMFRQLAVLISSVVSGREFETEKNFKTDYYANASSYWLKMTPANRRLKAFFNYIELTVDKNSLVAVKMFLNENEGDSTTITFGNHKVNASIDDKVFQLN